jgi:DNA-binding transcriptional LysR family regulator
MALQFEENKNLDSVVIPVATFHYAFYASRRYIEMYGRPNTAAEIAGHRAIHHTAQSRQKENWAPETSALQTLWSTQLETNSSAAMFFALKAGAGLALMPTGISVIAPDLEMLLDKPAAKLRLFLVHHRDIARMARVRRLIEWVKSIFDPNENPWFQDEFIHPNEFKHLAADQPVQS